jgi:plasmid stability protein
MARSRSKTASVVSPNSTRPIVVRMTDDLYEAVKARAVREERSVAQEIRHVLRAHTANG